MAIDLNRPHFDYKNTIPKNVKQAKVLSFSAPK